MASGDGVIKGGTKISGVRVPGARFNPNPPSFNYPKETAPKTPRGRSPHSVEELTYDQAVERFKGSAVRLPSREEFARLAGDQAVNDYRRTINQNNADWERGAAEQKQQDEWNTSIEQFQRDLDLLGQGTRTDKGKADLAINYRNIAQVSMALMSQTGDTPEEQAGRETAAQILYQYLPQLRQHINVIDPDGRWWEENAPRINKTLDGLEASGLRGNFKRGLEVALGSDPGKYIMEGLNQAGQGAANTLVGLTAAIDQNDEIGAADALRYAGSSAAQGVLGAVDYAAGAPTLFTGNRRLSQILGGDRNGATERIGISPDRLIQGGDTLYSPDQDQDQTINLREAVGRDADSGGRLAGVFDTIGLAAIDPTTYVGLGAAQKTKASITILESSSDQLAVKAGVMLRNGARMSELDPLLQSSAKAALAESAVEAVARMTPAQLARAKVNPRNVIKSLTRTANEERSFVNTLTRIKTDGLQQAVEHGTVPGVRFAGRTAVPMRRVYNALGIVDQRLASEAGWAERLLATANLKEPDELLGFIRQWTPGTEMSDALKEQVRGWDAVANRLGEPPETWLDDLLQRADDPATAFDEIEAFGRALLDDRVVNDWRPWFETQWRPQVVDTENAFRVTRDADGNLVSEGSDYLANARMSGELSDYAKGVLGDDLFPGTRRAVEALKLDELPLVSARRIQRNLDVFEDPYRWVVKDGIKPRGLRSLAAKDTIIGNLVRRVSDTFSPRAGVRRTKGLRVAGLVDDAEVIAAAKGELFNDHLNRMGLDKYGSSKVAEAAQAELKANGNDADVWEQAMRFLTENEDNVPALIDMLKSNDMPAMSQLVDVMQNIRDDIFRLSALSGADEVAMLARRGYMPRVYSDDARAAYRTAEREGNTALTDAFEKLGLGDKSNRRGARYPQSPLSQQGHLKGRTWERDVENIYELNDKAREELAAAGLDGADGFKLYEDNPMRALLLRSRQAHEAYIYSDMISQLTKIKDDQGLPLAYWAATKGDIKDVTFTMAHDRKSFGRGNFVERTLPGGGKMWVDRTVLDHVEQARRIMGAPDTNGTLKGFFDKWNGLWGAYATSPLIGFAFHSRNAQGNFFNMLMAGMRNPAYLYDAFRAQRIYAEIRTAMRETGGTFDEVVERLGVNPAQAEQLRLARMHGILDAGQTADIFSKGFDPINGEGKGQLINPVSTNNIVVSSGHKLGNAIESNARMALFMDGLNSGLTPSAAAARVRTFLFDYQDLTDFESNNVRVLNRFYTYTRKNTALQLRMMLSQPGAALNAQRAADATVDAFMYGVDGDTSGGERVTSEPGNGIPPWAEGRLRLFGNILVGADTPLTSSFDTMDALNAILKTPARIGIYALAKPGTEKAEAGEMMQDDLLKGLTLLSGGPVEGIKTTAEFATRTDLYSGASLDYKDEKWLDTFTRLVDVVFPIAGKTQRTGERLTDDSTRGDLANILFGLTVVPNIDDPEKRRIAMASLNSELYRKLDEARDNLGAAGVDVPTWDDMVEMGKLGQRNQALEFLLYNTVAGEPLTAEQRQRLEQMVPKAVLTAAGYDLPAKAEDEKSTDERWARVQKLVTAMQGLGIEVDDRMLEDLILRESGATVSMAKELGLEPSFQKNPYLDRKTLTPEEEEAQYQRELADNEKLIADLAGRFGMSVDELRQSHPLVADAERRVAQMRAAGFSDGEIMEEMRAKLSREKQALFFGSDTLDREFSYDKLTPDEVRAFERKASAAQSELNMLSMLALGRLPSQAELNEWLSEALLTAPEQRALGFDNYSAPKRKNVTPDSVYDERLNQKVTAAQRNTSFLSGLKPRN